MKCLVSFSSKFGMCALMRYPSDFLVAAPSVFLECILVPFQFALNTFDLINFPTSVSHYLIVFQGLILFVFVDGVNHSDCFNHGFCPVPSYKFRKKFVFGLGKILPLVFNFF